MTTNQTIDGVPREQVERALDAIEQVGLQDKFIDYTFVRTVKQELRALLDAPAKPVEGLEADNVKLAADRSKLSAELETLRKAYKSVLAQLDAAQPQGEPVVWFDPSDMARLESGGLASIMVRAHKNPHFQEPLYREQPAPVSAVRMCACNQGRMECNGKCKPEAPKSGPCKLEPVHTGYPVPHTSFTIGPFGDGPVPLGVDGMALPPGNYAIFGEDRSQAMVLPEPLQDPGMVAGLSSRYAQGWNACLDAVTSLTATATIPEKLEMRDGLHTYEYVTGYNAAIEKMLGAEK